jgi:hypothetical protein
MEAGFDFEGIMFGTPITNFHDCPNSIHEISNWTTD